MNVPSIMHVEHKHESHQDVKMKDDAGRLPVHVACHYQEECIIYHV